MRFVYEFEILLNNKFSILLSMTRKILLGITITAIVLVLSIGTQSPVFAMTNNTQNDAAKTVSSPMFVSSTDSMMLVATSPTVKGGKATFMLVPRPAEGIDGISLSTQATPDMILVAQLSQNGGKPTLAWIPRPVERIDDIPLQEPDQQNSEMLVSSPKPSDPNPMMLVATSPTVKGGKATFMLVPKIAEGIDGIPIPKQAAPDMILVAQPSQNGAKPTLAWIPRPVEGIDGIPMPKLTPSD